MRKALAIVGVASCLAATAHAGDTPQVPEGLLACAKIQDTAARVHCYDAQVAAMKHRSGGAESAPASSSSPPPTTPRRTTARIPPKEPSSADEDSAAAHFGEETLPPAQQPKSSRAHETLVSSITNVSKGGEDIYFFSLANGQIWREEGQGAEKVIFFRPGVPVRIERGALDSYHMAAVGAKNWMYVTRVR